MDNGNAVGGQGKRKKNFYTDVSKKRYTEHLLQPELRGFLISCNNRELECVRESYNILNEFSEKLYPVTKETPAKSGDLEAELAKEIEDLKDKPKRFKQANTRCKNVIFIQAPDFVDPLRLVDELFKETRESQKQRARFALRFIPVSITCKATVEAIGKCVSALLDSDDITKDAVTYMVQIKIRNNSELKRLDIIEAIPNIVKEKRPEWKVNFDSPKITLNLDVAVKVCCVSFLPDFFELSKYNILEYGAKFSKEIKESKTTVKPESTAAEESD